MTKQIIYYIHTSDVERQFRIRVQSEPLSEVFRRSSQGYTCGPKLHSILFHGFIPWQCIHTHTLMESLDGFVGHLLPDWAMAFCSPRKQLAFL